MNKILLTGAGGFFGQIIHDVLVNKHEIVSLGVSSSNDYRFDLAIDIPQIHDQCELVIHAAGKAHTVPESVEEVEQFYAVNYTGCLNLVKGLEKMNNTPTYFVFISTVAVYGVERGVLITENQSLNGVTPYAKSKIRAEELLQNWCRTRNIRLTILRLPLLIGESPPGNLGAMIKWMKRGLYFGIGNGASKKSMVLASDVARFIPHIATIGGTYNLTDGYHPSVCELENALATRLGIRKPVRIPDPVIKGLAKIGDKLGTGFPLNSDKYEKLTSTLTFSDKLARDKGWNPRTVLSYLQDHE